MSENNVLVSNDTASFQRAVSLEFIRNSGGFAVKAIRGQKEPARGWDPRMNNEAKSAQLVVELERSNDNLGIHLQGDLVDVDVDAENADQFLTPALDYFLPPCSHIWGRPSRKRTHRVYLIKSDDRFDPAQYPILGRLKRIPEVKVELRGGPLSRGEYSLLPGSIHPSGEEYQWADLARARSTPSVSEVDTILKAVRMAGVVSLLAPVWTEGIRQQLTMCLAGFLHRALAIGSALGEGLFFLNKEESRMLLDGLLEIAGDEPADRGARIKAFEKTWEKADKGLPVVGAPRLSELIDQPDLVSKLYTLLTDNPNMERVEQFTNRFYIWKGPALAIDIDLVKQGHSRPFMTRQNFASSYGHMFIEISDKRRLLPEMLWSMNSAVRVDGFTFAPGEGLLVNEKDGDKVNQWSGFAVPFHPEPVTEIEVGPFLHYLREIVCSSDKELFDWVLAWCANMFGRPGHKSGTALALVGVEGAGKSILGHSILGKIIGTAHYTTTNSVDNVVRNFNAGFVNKLLIQCDEATNSRQKMVAARLKSFITDPLQQVEPKGVDSYLVPNHARMLFTSNETEDALNLSSSEDRRFTVIEVSSSKAKGHQQYWVDFLSWLDREGTLAKIHRFLRDHKYEPTLVVRPAKTLAKQNMARSSWDPFDGWLASIISRGHPLSDRVHTLPFCAFVEYDNETIDRSTWPQWVSITSLVQDFKYYMQSNQIKDNGAVTETSMLTQFQKRGIPVGEQRLRPMYTSVDDRSGLISKFRPYTFSMPPINAVKAYMLQKHGFDVSTVEAGKDVTDDMFKEEIPNYLRQKKF